jgi:cytochrome oxidase assembly protein ShyY1
MSVPSGKRSFGFGIFTLAMVVLFVGLGIWQLQRRVEKHALIAALTERLAAPPQALPEPSQWSALAPDRDEFRRVSFEAIYQPVRSASVYSSGSAVRSDISGPGVWAFMPARVLSDGAVVVINRGFVPNADPSRPSTGGFQKVVERVPARLTGYIRFPERAGLLTPAADSAKALWFVRDVPDMAKAMGWGEVAPFYLDLELPVPSDGIPKPGPLEVHLKDDHLQYAITWFGLAVAVVLAFAVWLWGQRPTSRA